MSGMDAEKIAQVLNEITEAEGEAPLILSEHVRLALRTYFARLGDHPATDLYAMVISEVEKPLIETVLAHCGHNQSKAAQVLGLSRSTLRKKIAQYGID